MRRTLCGGSAYRAAMADPIALPPPPRDLPIALRLVLLLRGGLAVAGWLVLGLGGALAVAIGANAEPWNDPFAGAERAYARVVATETTSVRVNKRTVHAVRFEWPAAAPRHRGVSYMDGQPPATGSTIAVRWLPGEPPQACAVGMRSAPLPRAARFVYVLPVLGLALLVVGAARGRRQIRLLRDGLLARGVCTAKRPTNGKVNGRPVQILTFRYVDAKGRKRTTEVRTHRVDPLLDDAEELLLHDPADGSAVLWDALPVQPRPDGANGLQPPTTAEFTASLLAPTIAAVAWSIAQAFVGAS